MPYFIKYTVQSTLTRLLATASKGTSYTLVMWMRIWIHVNSRNLLILWHSVRKTQMWCLTALTNWVSCRANRADSTPQQRRPTGQVQRGGLSLVLVRIRIWDGAGKAPSKLQCLPSFILRKPCLEWASTGTRSRANNPRPQNLYRST